MKAYTSRHGEDRMRKRLGLPKKTVARMAQKAFEEGRPRTEFTGSFRRYLDKVYLTQQTANNIRVHGQNLFIFAGRTLVTAWVLPNKYRKAATSS